MRVLSSVPGGSWRGCEPGTAWWVWPLCGQRGPCRPFSAGSAGHSPLISLHARGTEVHTTARHMRLQVFSRRPVQGRLLPAGDISCEIKLGRDVFKYPFPTQDLLFKIDLRARK